MKDQWDQFWVRNSHQTISKPSWSKIRITKILDPYVERPELKILDAGCGSGFFSNYFLEKGCLVWACDYSDEAMDVTKKMTENRCQKYLKVDLLDENLVREYPLFFDLIFSDGLFEHFDPEEQRQLIQNLIGLKKEEGIIVTFVPNKYSWWTMIRPLMLPGIKEKPFTIGELKALHTPLEVIEYGGINILPIKYSPDPSWGDKIGMLLYVIAK